MLVYNCDLEGLNCTYFNTTSAAIT